MVRRGSLEIRGLTFSFEKGEKPVIDDFSAEFPLGSRVAILGLNGSGKTTFMNLLLGLLKPESGTVLIRENSRVESLASLNGAVGYLPQMENIPFDYYVKEYILLGRLPYIPIFSFPTAIDEKLVTTVLEVLEITGLSNKRLSEISGGELQRVRLARILAQEPEIILMDEPTSHLDIKHRKSIYLLVNQFSQLGKTVIYSSHDPQEIVETSDYCVLMGKGRKTILEKTSSLAQSDLLSEYFETPLVLSKLEKSA